MWRRKNSVIWKACTCLHWYILKLTNSEQSWFILWLLWSKFSAFALFDCGAASGQSGKVRFRIKWRTLPIWIRSYSAEYKADLIPASTNWILEMPNRLYIMLILHSWILKTILYQIWTENLLLPVLADSIFENLCQASIAPLKTSSQAR